MPCTASLNLNPAAGDNGMDSAIDTGTNIVGIRGNRLFVCNRTTGAILSQLDVGQYARSNGCLSYDSASTRIFAAAWNCPQWAVDATFQSSTRNLFRLHVAANTLVLDQSVDIGSTFGLAANRSGALDVGILSMHPIGVSGNIYCKWAARAQLGPGTGGSLRFSATNLASFTNAAEGLEGGYNSITYGLIGGHDNAIMPDPSGGPQVVMFDYTSSVENTFNVALPKLTVAVGFAPTQQHVFVTDVSQFIYVFTTAGALVTTINTARSAFNGLVARFDSTDGNIYVPGGNDNSMCVINPATNAFTITTGLDCPVDYVRAGSVRFAVQAGSTPLKAF